MYTYLNSDFVFLKFIRNLMQKLYFFRISFFASAPTIYLPACPKQNIAQPSGEYLLDTYGNSILRLAYSYLHNMDDAEDILQETFIVLMINKESQLLHFCNHASTSFLFS